MAPINVLFVALLNLAPAEPDWERGLPGGYRTSTGFEVYGLELSKNHKAEYTYRPDHPGGRSYAGEWSFDGTVVEVKLASKTKPRKGYRLKFVPVVWGDRQYLVSESEVRDFAGQALKWADTNHTESAQKPEMHRAPFMKMEASEFKRRFGPIQTPDLFAPWFAWSR